MVAVTIVTLLQSDCFAGYSCDDWITRGGYCVDYVKTKNPIFPIPKSSSEISRLKNIEVSKVVEGDVVIFDQVNYWHVAYVEKVHRNQHGHATAIDVSEMNYGEQISFDEFKRKWNQNNENEWKRALSCGVTSKYGQLGIRNNIALSSVLQVWSPASAVSQLISLGPSNGLMNSVREELNQIIRFTGRIL
jgi:hypothetical protein